jgi:hypothetical protein
MVWRPDYVAKTPVQIPRQTHRAMLEKWQTDLRAGVPDARIVELPDANLYMFISNEADVIRELRAFVATLPQ